MEPPLLPSHGDLKSRIFHYLPLILFFTSWNILTTSTIFIHSTEIQQLMEQNKTLEAQQKDLNKRIIKEEQAEAEVVPS